MLEHLSSCRSPQAMMGSIIREYIPQYYPEFKPENLVSVSIMPCTGKKVEARRDEFKRPDGSYEIDYVLTTQEIARMIKAAGIDIKNIKPEKADSPFFVNSLAPDDVWVLKKEDDGFSNAKRASDYKFVKELTDEGVFVGDLWYDKYFG